MEEEIELDLETLIKGPPIEVTFEIEKGDIADKVVYHHGENGPEFTLFVPNLDFLGLEGRFVKPHTKIEITTELGDIRSMEQDFAPWMTGQELLKYYEDRTLTEEQTQAIIEAMNKKTEAIPAAVREAFLENGKIDCACPSHEIMMKIVVDNIHPYLEVLPKKELFARLQKKIKPDKRIPKKQRPNNEFESKKGYLYQDGVCTYIPIGTIEAAWNGLVRLLGHDEAIKALAKNILNRLSREEL